MQVIELFKASDKYDVGSLLKECVHVFHRITQARHVACLLQVTLSSCVHRALDLCMVSADIQAAQVADERGSEELRSVCIDVACRCLPNIVVRLLLALEQD